ncbi:uncharacterized protein LOC111870108 isoform X4 [Cryptotermes secundus]|uniref:uncharacterized protein LOC111870108 isoform X4 n=1 Tax=Cryptotermes secundus TaxID=105785 RepID=UPI000CD7D604|nr:uncharacterized protein LOC111870108 isoform X4 [Cryptotermes secundus]
MPININKICRMCMCSENLLLLLVGNSENLRDRIQTISFVIEINARDGLLSQVCQLCVLQKPKEEGSVEDTRMIGNKFCDVTVIAPHYVGNHASEQALAEKDLLSMHQDWFTMTENRCTKRSIMQLI